MKRLPPRSELLSHCLLAVCLAAVLAGCDGMLDGHSAANPPAPNPSAVKPFAFAQPDVVLLITGGTNGRMEVCNCSGPMPGGLARRSGLVRSYRHVFPQTLLLDVSDAFWVEPEDIRNEFLVRGYGQVGYDAFVLGNQEWAAWPKTLTRIVHECKDVPFLSTTIAPKNPPRSWPVKGVIRRQVGGVDVAIVSAITEDSILFFPDEVLATMAFEPEAKTVQRVKALKAEGCLVVAVVPMMDEQFDRAVKALPADVFVRAHTQRFRKDIYRVAGKPVVRIGGQEVVGALAMQVRDGQVTNLDWRVEIVDERWPLDRRLLNTYEAYAHTAMRAALDKDRTEGLAYVASAECGKCHVPQYEAWKKSRHAHAWDTLVKRKSTGDPNCVMCHSSGFGTKAGFYTYAKTPHLANVNCQDCHRVNVAEHQKQGRPIGFKFPKVDEQVCTTCHTPVTDPKFSLKGKVHKVRCPPTPKP